MKQIWFEKNYKDMVVSGKLRRTFRDLPEEKKDNDYKVGEEVWCRIYENESFLLEQRIIKILKVELRKLDSLSDGDFLNSDASCREDLKKKLEKYYKREYLGNELVRVIDFDYVAKSPGTVFDFAYSLPHP